MESTLSVTYTLKVRVDLTMPDDKLISFLEGEIDLEPCLKVEIDNLPDGFEDHELDLSTYIEPMEIDLIDRGGDAYNWDGSKLIKL